MEITHDKQNKRFYIVKQGITAYLGYMISGDILIIVTTQVPKPLGGQGIAAALVEATYNYALSEGLKPTSTCSYAVAWLDRHTK